MNLLHSITDTHTKGKHLSFENRVEIQTLLQKRHYNAGFSVSFTTL
ncbi:helix-turn-helix domain-containing protein, partial [Lactobacillus johnsonii]